MRYVLIALFLLGAAPAFGHAQLQTASPRVGSVVAAAPSEVTLEFSEAVEPRFSRVVVTGPDGVRADKGDLHTAPDNPKRLVLGLAAGKPGRYAVSWHAVSVDTHKTEGEYTFRVGAE